jgi:hypothetical protein
LLTEDRMAGRNDDADLDALISNLRAAVISGVQEEAAANANSGMNVAAGPAAAGAGPAAAGAGNANVMMSSRKTPAEKWASLPPRAPSSRRAAVEATAKRTEELMKQLKAAEDKKFAKQARREAANYKEFITARIPILYGDLPRTELEVLQKKLVRIGESMAAAEVGKLIAQRPPRQNGPSGMHSEGGKRRLTTKRKTTKRKTSKRKTTKRKGSRRS